MLFSFFSFGIAELMRNAQNGFFQNNAATKKILHCFAFSMKESMAFTNDTYQFQDIFTSAEVHCTGR